MKKNIILLTITFAVIFCSCSKDYNLYRSIFVQDPDNPGLPKYSEWGYNTFGAYIDRKTFTSNYYDLPAKVIVRQDTMNIIFLGEIGYKPVSMKFSFIGYSPSNYKALSILNEKSIDLKSDDCIVTITEKINDKDTTITFNILEGEFIFNKVQNLYVDNESTQSILSGYFDFKTEYKQEPISISKGRFDVGIGDDNFFNY